MINIENNGRPVDVSEIARIEADLKAQIPATYREFLLANNGGIPSPDIIDIDGLPGSPTDIQVFFGIDRDIESSNIMWNFRLLSEQSSNGNYLPIACDSGGNLFCLCISGDTNHGAVYYILNYEGFLLYTVANDFNEFIGRIRAWE